MDKIKWAWQMMKQKCNDSFCLSHPRHYGKSLFCSIPEHSSKSYTFGRDRLLIKGVPCISVQFYKTQDMIIRRIAEGGLVFDKNVLLLKSFFII